MNLISTEERLSKEGVKYTDYIYKNGAQVPIPGELVTALLEVLHKVKEDQTHYVFNHHYDTDVKVIKNLKGNVEEVKTTKVVYPTNDSFFGQVPQTATTLLGNACLDLLVFLELIHVEQIEKGNALQVGTVIPPQNVKQ